MKLTDFLLVGTILMSIPILLVSIKYRIHVFKGVLIALTMTLVGTIGTYVMFYIENKAYGGLSFYGAVFLIPLAFPLVALILRISYCEIMDMCAVGECVMLAMMKVHCIMSDCCKGREIFVAANGVGVIFPSRLIEMITALAIFILLIRWVSKGQHKGELYSWYLIFYGSTRFILNMGRQEWVVRRTFLPIGNIWSVIAVFIGFICLQVARKQKIKIME